MISKLPEEMLHEILSYAIPPPDFDVSISQPYTRINPGKSRCGLLLVCKQWRRVGVPLVYRHLSISDQKHTKVIAALFDANPRLGLAVKSLSLYGGMGKEFHAVAKHIPNLDTLNVSVLLLKSRDSVAGLRRALPTMHIKHLCYSKGLRGRGNKSTKEVDTLVLGAISQHWSSTLKTLTFDDQLSRPLTPAFIDMLRELPLLKKITLNTGYLEATMGSLRVIFNRLTELPSLSSIHALGVSHEAQVRAYFEEFHTPNELRDMVTFSRCQLDDLIDTVSRRLALGSWYYDSDSDGFSDE